MPTPHDSWARVYDDAYEHAFAGYDELTAKTVAVVLRLLPGRPSIIDFGAGTGRLAIPLAEAGCRVTAVEPSRGMLDELERKRGSLPITTLQSTMQDPPPIEPHDLALCVFTVLSYVLDEAGLHAAAASMARSLRPGGLLLLDIAWSEIFRGFAKSTESMSRKVTITQESAHLYRYEESITRARHDGAETFTDTFSIRHWSPRAIQSAMESAGCHLERDLSANFGKTGADYLLFRKS